MCNDWLRVTITSRRNKRNRLLRVGDAGPCTLNGSAAAASQGAPNSDAAVLVIGSDFGTTSPRSPQSGAWLASSKALHRLDREHPVASLAPRRGATTPASPLTSQHGRNGSSEMPICAPTRQLGFSGRRVSIRDRRGRISRRAGGRRSVPPDRGRRESARRRVACPPWSRRRRGRPARRRRVFASAVRALLGLRRRHHVDVQNVCSSPTAAAHSAAGPRAAHEPRSASLRRVIIEPAVEDAGRRDIRARYSDARGGAGSGIRRSNYWGKAVPRAGLTK
jgi:hypothetical protein